MNARPTLILPAQRGGPMKVKAPDGSVSPFDEGHHKGQSFDVIVPGQLVRLYAHELPKMREREKIAAARFAIEERIAAALEGQHIAFGRADDKRLAVMDSDELSRILAELEAQDIEAADIYADFDWAAPQSNPIVLADRIIFAAPEGYTIDPDWAESAVADMPPSDWDTLQTHAGKISLRQGDFARKSGLNLPFAALSKIAALAMLTGISWLALQAAQTRATLKQADDLKSQTAALYTQMTGQPAPANPALAVTRAVKAGPATDTSFLPLLAGMNGALLQTSNIEIRRRW